MFDSPNQASPRDGLGLKALMSQMPTKEERAESQRQVVVAQEWMTATMTEEMSNVITSNHAMEMTAKKELASEEMLYKTRLAVPIWLLT